MLPLTSPCKTGLRWHNNPDLITAVRHQCSKLLSISLKDYDLSVSNTYPVTELSRVAISRLSKMWGQDIYDPIPGLRDIGNG